MFWHGVLPFTLRNLHDHYNWFLTGIIRNDSVLHPEMRELARGGYGLYCKEDTSPGSVCAGVLACYVQKEDDDRGELATH